MLSLFPLQYYGPGCAASYMDGEGVFAPGPMRADARMASAMTAAGAMDIRGTIGVDGSAGMDGEATMEGLMRANSRMGVSMNLGDFPSAFEVAQEVWALNIASFQVPAAGGKLNAAGTAGDPWTKVIESGLTAEEVLRIIAATLAGNTSGMETGSVVFKGLDGATDRIAGTLGTDGNRSGIVLDGA